MEFYTYKTIRNKTGLYCNNYCYRKSYTLANRDICWRCSTAGCSATVTTSPKIDVIRSVANIHNGHDNHSKPQEMELRGNLKKNNLSKSKIGRATPRTSLNSTPARIDKVSVNLHDGGNMSLTENDTDHDMASEIEMATERLSLNNYNKELDKLEARDSSSVEVQTELKPSHVSAEVQTVETSVGLYDVITESKAVQTTGSARFSESYISFPESSNEGEPSISSIIHQLNKVVRECKIKIEELESKLEIYRNSYHTFQSKLETMRSRRKLKKCADQFHQNNIGSLPKYIEPQLVNVMSQNLERELVRNKDECSTFRRNVILISDNLGRGVIKPLQNSLPPNYNVSAYVSTGAPLNYLARNCVRTVSQLTKNDHVILIAGTNDFDHRSNMKDVRCFLDNLIKFSKSCEGTNLILATIPYRYDLAENSVENRLITIVNRAIRTCCLEFDPSGQCVDLWTVQRDWHTGHGLNFNRKGKLEFARILTSLVLKDCVEIEDGHSVRSFKSLNSYLSDDSAKHCHGSNSHESINLTLLSSNALPLTSSKVTLIKEKAGLGDSGSDRLLDSDETWLTLDRTGGAFSSLDKDYLDDPSGKLQIDDGANTTFSASFPENNTHFLRIMDSIQCRT
jgi:hypothetical protein